MMRWDTNYTWDVKDFFMTGAQPHARYSEVVDAVQDRLTDRPNQIQLYGHGFTSSLHQTTADNCVNEGA